MKVLAPSFSSSIKRLTHQMNETKKTAPLEISKITKQQLQTIRSKK